MKKMCVLFLAALAMSAHANGNVSIGIAIPGVYLDYSSPQYRHHQHTPGPRYYAPPPVYYVPMPLPYYSPNPRSDYEYVNPNPNHNYRPYRQTCTTYYTSQGPRSECF